MGDAFGELFKMKRKNVWALGFCFTVNSNRIVIEHHADAFGIGGVGTVFCLGHCFYIVGMGFFTVGADIFMMPLVSLPW